MRAIFLDRDGVVNELVYYPEHGIVDSPFTVEQFKLYPDVAQAINEFHKKGFKVIIVSNQPGIAKEYYSMETFEEIRAKMRDELAKEGAYLDGEYYCLHHPSRMDCDCRKPKPGLLLQASEGKSIDLSESWMIGDGLTDIKAGKAAGCKTILIGKMKCELCRLMEDMDASPDAIASNLLDATQIVLSRQHDCLP